MARDFSTLIEQHYARCDKLLAPVLDKVDEDTLLFVLSDHGFNTFRRAFDTNTWLWQNGLLALKDGRKPGEDLGDGFAAVDWSRTYAYAVGLGGVYLNFKGREREGILEEGTEAERCVTRSKAGWRGFRMRRRSGRRCAAYRAGKSFTLGLTRPMRRTCW